MMKCVTGFNQYAMRDKLINKNVSDRCDMCGATETWIHVIKCPCLAEQVTSFMDTMTEKIKPFGNENVDVKFMSDNLRKYLLGHDSITGSQLLIGYDKIFRGVIMRDWVSNNETEIKYTACNKVIVSLCTNFYLQQWKSRNERRHSHTLRRKRLTEWLDKEIADSKYENFPEAQRLILLGAEKVRNMSNDCIQKWLVQLHSVRKNSKKEKTQDIRSFCVPRKESSKTE